MKTNFKQKKLRVKVENLKHFGPSGPVLFRKGGARDIWVCPLDLPLSGILLSGKWRILHGRLEIRHLSSRVENYFTSERRSLVKYFSTRSIRNVISPRGDVIFCLLCRRLYSRNQTNFGQKIEKISSVYLYSEYHSNKAYNFSKFHRLSLK